MAPPHYCHKHLGLYSLCGRTSYRKISRSNEAERFRFIRFKSLWNLHLSSTAEEMPAKFQSDTIIIASNLVGSILHEIFGKMSYRLVNRGTELAWNSSKFTAIWQQKNTLWADKSLGKCIEFHANCILWWRHELDTLWLLCVKTEFSKCLVPIKTQYKCLSKVNTSHFPCWTICFIIYIEPTCAF